MIRYVVIPKRTSRNWGIYKLFGDWPINVMGKRGYLDRIAFVRPSEPLEAIIAEESTRYYCERFRTLEQLHADEFERFGKAVADANRERLLVACCYARLSSPEAESEGREKAIREYHEKKARAAA